MKREKQINESKELIFKAFMQLLNRKNEEDITLTEIAEVAGVGRMTIYRHFKEKEDILLYKVQQYYEVGKRQLHDKNLTLLDLLAFKYNLIKESPNLEYFYKNNKLQSLFDTFRTIYSADIKNIFPPSIDAYTVAFILSGMDAITLLWLQNGKNEDPMKMAQLTAQIIKRQLV